MCFIRLATVYIVALYIFVGSDQAGAQKHCFCLCIGNDILIKEEIDQAISCFN